MLSVLNDSFGPYSSKIEELFLFRWVLPGIDIELDLYNACPSLYIDDGFNFAICLKYSEPQNRGVLVSFCTLPAYVAVETQTLGDRQSYCDWISNAMLTIKKINNFYIGMSKSTM